MENKSWVEELKIAHKTARDEFRDADIEADSAKTELQFARDKLARLEGIRNQKFALYSKLLAIYNLALNEGLIEKEK